VTNGAIHGGKLGVVAPRIGPGQIGVTVDAKEKPMYGVLKPAQVHMEPPRLVVFQPARVSVTFQAGLRLLSEDAAETRTRNHEKRGQAPERQPSYHRSPSLDLTGRAIVPSDFSRFRSN
jgi:hypothetical protein